jgi:hypothetical protein
MVCMLTSKTPGIAGRYQAEAWPRCADPDASFDQEACRTGCSVQRITGRLSLPALQHLVPATSTGNCACFGQTGPSFGQISPTISACIPIGRKCEVSSTSTVRTGSSTDSAACFSSAGRAAVGPSALFASFIATMAGSDFSGPFIIGFGYSPSRCGPATATPFRSDPRPPRFRYDPFARDVALAPRSGSGYHRGMHRKWDRTIFVSTLAGCETEPRPVPGP